MSKHMLFYSNFCEYCSNVINDLIKKDIKTHFLLICIENKKFRIPSFVTCVPLVISTEKQIFIEDSLERFIENIYKNKLEALSASELQCYNETSNSYFNFSFVDDSEINSNQTFLDIGAENNNNNDNMPPPIQIEKEKEKNRIDSSVFERFKAERDKDLPQDFRRAKI